MGGGRKGAIVSESCGHLSGQVESEGYTLPMGGCTGPPWW